MGLIRYTHETKLSRIKVVVGNGFNTYHPELLTKKFYFFSFWENVPVFIDDDDLPVYSTTDLLEALTSILKHLNMRKVT